MELDIARPAMAMAAWTADIQAIANIVLGMKGIEGMSVDIPIIKNPNTPTVCGNSSPYLGSIPSTCPL